MAEPKEAVERVTETMVPLSFGKFAEKWFVSLATSGIQDLRQSGAHPSKNGLSGLCIKAYLSYLYTVKHAWKQGMEKHAEPGYVPPVPVGAK